MNVFENFGIFGPKNWNIGQKVIFFFFFLAFLVKIFKNKKLIKSVRKHSLDTRI